MGGNAPLLVCLIWATTTLADRGQGETNAAKFCTVSVADKQIVKDKCSSWVSFYKDGYFIDKIASNLTHYSDNDVKQKLNDWYSDPKHSPMCQFFKMVESNRTSCCGGWQGNSCQTPICNPSCSSFGSCVSPNQCECQSDYVGPYCDDKLSVVTSDMKYCYNEATCAGQKPQGAPNVMSREDCFTKYNGGSWGVSNGFDCTPSSDGTKGINIHDYDPEEPTDIPNVGNLPSRTCMGTSPNYYRTFDGRQLNFNGQCEYLLFGDGIRSVTVESINCDSFSQCRKRLTINLNGKDQVIAQGDHITDGETEVMVDDSHGYASQTSAVHIEKNGENYFLEYGTLIVAWDSQSSWYLTLQEPFNKNGSREIRGFCGNYDGDATNDLVDSRGVKQTVTAFGNSWSVYDYEKACSPASPSTYQCSNKTMEDTAKTACSALLYDPFTSCQKTADVSSFYARCVNDFCSVLRSSEASMIPLETTTVTCGAFTTYAQLCMEQQVPFTWRSSHLCPKQCPPGLIFTDCINKCVATCANIYAADAKTCASQECYPGCQCPQGTFMHNGTCVNAEQCPCSYQGQSHSQGEKIRVRCNYCTCIAGRWNCTENKCTKECTVFGATTFETFDEAQYTFSGPPCTYILVEMKDAEIIGALSRGVSPMSVYYQTRNCYDGWICIDKVIVNQYSGNNPTVVELRSLPNNESFSLLEIAVNGVVLDDPIRKPYYDDELFVKQVSSVFASVQGFGLNLLYDKNGRLYIYLDPFYTGKVQGLCGNMDGSTFSEFTSRNGIVESITGFAMSYSNCPELTPSTTPQMDICSYASQMRDFAKSQCLNVGLPEVFTECTKDIMWTKYREICQSEICSIKASKETPIPVCTMISALAHRCAESGHLIDWMSNPQLANLCSSSNVDGYKCKIDGQVYSECSPQAKYCRDLEHISDAPRDRVCIGGCYCNEKDHLVNAHDQCVPVEKCTCYDEVTKQFYEAGDILARSCGNCVCTNGIWDCGKRICVNEVICPGGQVYRNDVKNCDTTCFNYGYCKGNEVETSACACPLQSVMHPNGTCVPASQCPCIFNGVNYAPGQSVVSACKKCTCNNRSWTCVTMSSNKCAGLCTAKGDPHYVTFDRQPYSYQGSCDYIMARSSKPPSFTVTTTNIACGTSGVTCTKAVSITTETLKINLVHGMQPTINGESITQHNIKFNGGSMITNELIRTVVLDIGLRISYDGGTKVFLYLDTYYSGAVDGLCGNFDGDSSNDLVDLHAGHLAVKPSQFGALWKLSGTCPEPDAPEDLDPCKYSPKREAWARESCRIISDGDVFKDCRAVVTDYDIYYKDCLYDACGCDTGGDCHCLCTAISAFAAACSRFDVCVSWRSLNLCPVMCPYPKIYSPCHSVCKDTCGKLGKEAADICGSYVVEGCYCPEGLVEDANGNCVEENECPCEYEGMFYPPGTAATINCQSCTCGNGDFNCTGDPCVTTCPPDKFLCEDMIHCINKHFRCDMLPDCPDLSDEKNCSYPCKHDEHECAVSQTCIPKNHYCDGEKDCPDGSDEPPDCGCHPPFFRCKTGQCIKPSQRCDKKHDCGVGDTSDEDNCTICSIDELPCYSNGTCYQERKRCDGIYDCADGSDEFDCVSTTVTPFTTVQTTPKAHCRMNVKIPSGEQAWVENDGIFGPTSGDTMVNEGDDLETNVKLHIGYCTECMCESDAPLDCQNVRNCWTNDTNQCQIFTCQDGKTLSTDKTQSCECDQDEIMVLQPPPECCACTQAPASCTITKDMIDIGLNTWYDMEVKKEKSTDCDSALRPLLCVHG